MIENVILDLDHTLIHCPENIHKITRQTCNHLRCHHISINGDLYIIFERPFLREFLRGLRGKRISVWTAADKTYATYIVDNILRPYLNKGQTIEIIWHREHCKKSEKKHGLLKHLDMFRYHYPKYKKETTIIIDDNRDLLKQPNNIYVIPRFTIDYLDDTELLSALRFVNSL